MSQNNIRYNANPKIDFSNPPSGDRVVTWFSSSAEFGLSRNEINQPIYIYEFFEDNRSVQKTYEPGDPTTNPVTGKFKALPSGDTSASSTKNIEYYNGVGDDRLSINVSSTAEGNYLTRGSLNTQVILFMHDVQYSDHFVCFNAPISNQAGVDVFYNPVDYLDYMQNPAPQNFLFDDLEDNVTNGGNFFNILPDSDHEYNFVAMSPDEDGDQGLMYINTINSLAARQHSYIILTAKPSGSNQDISDYLRCFGGGRLQIVDVTNTDNNLIYKFDESFAIYNDGTAGNRYVVFKSCKLLASSGIFSTSGQKFAVTVVPHVNEFKGLTGGAGNYFSGPTPTVTRTVFLENKGDTSYVGRRFEWGDKEGGDYWAPSDNADEFLAGNFDFKAFYRYAQASRRFAKMGQYSLDSLNLQVNGFISPFVAGLNMIDFHTLQILDGYGPYLEVEWDNSQNSEDLPNDDVQCVVSWNWSPKSVGTL